MSTKRKKRERSSTQKDLCSSYFHLPPFTSKKETDWLFVSIYNSSGCFARHCVVVPMYQQYGTLTPQDKAKNTKNFLKDWDPTLPFEAFAAKIDECVEIAQIGGVPISEPQILDNAHDIVLQHRVVF